jgi:hypothetical protein
MVETYLRAAAMEGSRRQLNFAPLAKENTLMRAWGGGGGHCFEAAELAAGEGSLPRSIRGLGGRRLVAALEDNGSGQPPPLWTWVWVGGAHPLETDFGIALPKLKT